jgi:hypothetical protein
MAHRSRAFLAALLLLVPGLTLAADTDLAGNWKVTILDQGEQPTLWLLHLESKDGKWGGKVLAVGGEKIPDTTVGELTVAADKVVIPLHMQGQTSSFEGKLPKDATGNIKGSMAIGRQLFPAMLEPTMLTTLDSFDVNKEIVGKGGNDLRYFSAVVGLLMEAADKKVKPEEVRGWTEKAFKAAEIYGPRWQQEIAVRMAHALVTKDGGYTDIALNYARRAERLLEPKAPMSQQLRVLSALADALKKANKLDEYKEVEARLDALEVGVKAEKYVGRKAKSEHVALVELFTGAQCPPCVGSDLAFDALGKTFKANEVVLLQYHVHNPGPDPLTNPSTEKRAEFYDKEIEGTPTMMMNGKALESAGGSLEDAPELYKDFRGILEPLLEKPATAKLRASAVQKGNKIDILAEVTDVDKDSDNLRLRLALVEEEVRYQGGNGLRMHHHVVRDMPGGAKGVAVKDKTAKQAVTVDLEELRATLTKYLKDFEKEYKKENPGNPAFPNESRPLELKNLKLVAFLQNDRTKEVLQTVQVDVRQAE